MAFALTPAQAYQGIIDYSTTEGRKLYESATRRLYPSEEGFDCNPENLHGFLELVANRANAFDWDFYDPAEDWDGQGVLMIAKADPSIDPDAGCWNLLEHHGEIDMELLNTQCKQFIGAESRRAQDDTQLFQCLFNSLTEAGRQKVLVWKKDFIISEPTQDIANQPCGSLLLKVIIRESHIDTNATTTAIRNKMSNLDDYIATIGQDITKFNAYVKSLVTSLEARGETSTDLLSNLFKGYKACSDKEFVLYIKTKEEKYEEGEDIDINKLMLLADNKYKILVEKGAWDAPSAEEEKIIALQAQVKMLQKKFDNKRSKNDKATGKGKGKIHPFVIVKNSENTARTPPLRENQAVLFHNSKNIYKNTNKIKPTHMLTYFDTYLLLKFKLQ